MKKQYLQKNINIITDRHKTRKSVRFVSGKSNKSKIKYISCRENKFEDNIIHTSNETIFNSSNFRTDGGIQKLSNQINTNSNQRQEIASDSSKFRVVIKSGETQMFEKNNNSMVNIGMLNPGSNGDGRTKTRNEVISLKKHVYKNYSNGDLPTTKKHKLKRKKIKKSKTRNSANIFINKNDKYSNLINLNRNLILKKLNQLCKKKKIKETNKFFESFINSTSFNNFDTIEEETQYNYVKSDNENNKIEIENEIIKPLTIDCNENSILEINKLKKISDCDHKCKKEEHKSKKVLIKISEIDVCDLPDAEFRKKIRELYLPVVQTFRNMN